MDYSTLSEQVRAGTVVKLRGPMRDQHRDAHRIADPVPGAIIRHWDPVTGIAAYSDVRAPGTETWIYLPSAPPVTASMGAVTPRR